MPSHLFTALILMLTVFPPDETLRRYGAADTTWQVETLRGVPFDADATITFPRRDKVAGSGPCNSFTSTNTTPYPWIELGPIAATRSACADLIAEQRFFEALRKARIAVIQEGRLILSTETNELLVFKARE